MKGGVHNPNPERTHLLKPQSSAEPSRLKQDGFFVPITHQQKALMQISPLLGEGTDLKIHGGESDEKERLSDRDGSDHRAFGAGDGALAQTLEWRGWAHEYVIEASLSWDQPFPFKRG